VDEPTYAFAASVRPWAQDWARHIADHGPGRLVDHVAERRSLERGEYRLLVIDADAAMIDAGTVQALHGRGSAVLAVWDPADPRTKDLALALGADRLIEADATAEEFVAAALAAVGTIPTQRYHPDHQRVARATPSSRPARGVAGRVVVVAGPVGDDAGEVAVELARDLAEGGRVVVLVDADEVHPSVSQRLGLPLLPNLRIAIDTLRERPVGLGDVLLSVPTGGFWVLGGMSDPARWAEISAAEVAGVVEALAGGCDLVVVQAGPMMEDLARHGGPDRYGITRRLLAMAGTIVGVGVATPTGLARLVAWVAEARQVAPVTRIELMVTRVPPGRARASEISSALAVTGAGGVHLVPGDPYVEAAAWDGTLVPRGPFTKAVAKLAAGLGAGARHG